MSALCIRVPALRGPLPGEALLLPAEGSCPVLRLWPGLPEEFSRPAAGGLTASGRRAVTVAAPAPEGPWHMPEDLPFSPREAAACLDDLQRMGDAVLSGQPVGTLGADVGRARRNSAESALRAGLMADGTLDILVCTTIIETGIDLPNVNTLIIENAENFGLAQLHQLRGRVGRSTRRAAAYLTYRRNRVLTEDQSKRLSAIREYAAFGSGFKIAMRDLEIRGAGNLLGAEQSGFLMSVGYDLYLRLLEEAVLEEQGKPPKAQLVCTADFTVPAAIPERYIPAPEQRMDLYRRMARVRTQEEGDDITDELIDRYGDPPQSVTNLIAIALLRARAAALGIPEMAQKENALRLSLPHPDFAQVAAVCGLEKYRRRLLFSAGEKPYLALRLKKGEDVLKLAGILLTDLEQAAAGAV